MRLTATRDDQTAEVFVLHDGEDSTRTDALHKFMETECPDQVWEGDEHGLVLWPAESDTDSEDDDPEPVRAEPGQLLVAVERMAVVMTHDRLWAHLAPKS